MVVGKLCRWVEGFWLFGDSTRIKVKSAFLRLPNATNLNPTISVAFAIMSDCLSRSCKTEAEWSVLVTCPYKAVGAVGFTGRQEL